MDSSTSGLVFHLGSGAAPEEAAAADDPMASLVYKVQPVPHSLLDFIFDFGTLSPTAELAYIRSMVATQLGSTIAESEVMLVSDLVAASQRYARDTEGDDSAASLRDVKRFLHLTEWFLTHLKSKKQTAISMPACAVTVSLAFVYWYRLPTLASRAGFWNRLRTTVDFDGSKLPKGGFERLYKPGICETVLAQISKRFTDNLEVDDDIAMNEALTENLFVTIVCVLNRLPVFLVGKPGTSKTLTLQVISNNLQGKQSPREFWRTFPAVYTFQYQCSPLSTGSSIWHQFNMARSYQVPPASAMATLRGKI